MVHWHRTSSFVFPGPPNLERSRAVRRSGTGAEFVDAAPSQHVSSTASMPGWTHQSCAAAPFIVRPAFLHYGCCGPYGGIDSIRQRLLRVHFRCTCPGFFPDKFHLELPDDHHQRAPTLRGVGRCVAAAGLELSAPLFQPHRVHVLIRCLLLPSQVAPSSPPSPLTTTARWSEVVGSLLLPLPPSQTSPRSVEASRARCARAVHVHVCCACTCTSSLTDQYQLNSDDTAA